MVRIAHARSSEFGTKDGKAGDQTKREVMITPFSGEWTEVYRPKKTKHAEIIAQKAEDAANNDHIGYSQYSRYSLFTAVCNNGYDIKSLTKDVNCDCSSLVMVCCRAAGITVPNGMYTGSEDADLMRTGNFTRFTKKTILQGRGLMRGDILRRDGHTAIVVEGSAAENTGLSVDYASKFNAKLAGKHLTTVKCFIRSGAGITKRPIGVLPVGSACFNYGFYGEDKRGVKWLLVQCGDKTGYVSERCLTI